MPRVLALALMLPEKPATALLSQNVTSLSQNVTSCIDVHHILSPDVVIRGCTAVIQAGGGRKNRAVALLNRGNAYLAKVTMTVPSQITTKRSGLTQNTP
jgi:hypothetical protein